MSIQYLMDQIIIDSRQRSKLLREDKSNFYFYFSFIVFRVSCDNTLYFQKSKQGLAYFFIEHCPIVFALLVF